MKNKLTHERANELLSYDPETGVITRKVSLVYSTPVGSIAGSVNKYKGYVAVFVDGTRYQAHRVAWLMMSGRWPRGHIDHVDGNRANNRWSNLREASVAENNQNMRAASNNTSGLRGVSWMSKAKKWRAQICLDKKITYLGLFDDKAEAHEAYLSAKRKIHPFCTI